MPIGFGIDRYLIKERIAQKVLICQDNHLSALDERMSSMYFGLRNSLGGSAHLRLEADQVDWLRARMGCGRDYRCVSRAYDRRIGQLDNY